MRVPEWIAHHFPKPESLNQLKSLLRGLSLHTVCEEAKCPNIGECFGKGTATFLILGDICTRNCRFCGIKKGCPRPVDDSEPVNVAQAVAKLGLSHVVITSVTRDDLADGGVSQFVATVREIHKLFRQIHRPVPTVELLIPYFDSLKQITELQVEVINHNIETVPRLYPEVRPNFKYQTSLKFLGQIKKLNNSIITKSGIMVGLGETKDEVIKVMQDLRQEGVSIFTIGQYLRPSGKQLPVVEYISPAQFLEYEKIGYELGFRYVSSGPYVRSSYNALNALQSCKKTLSPFL